MWIWLVGAIAAEVTATLSLRFSAGFTRLVPSLVVAYGLWSACGVALIALLGAAFLGEQLSWVQLAGIVLVIGGVLALELGGAIHAG
jgi:small multidrug resistance pump